MPAPEETTSGQASRTVRKLCTLCGNVRATRVCPTCGLDLDSGQLVAAPDAPRSTAPEQVERVRGKARGTLDLLTQTAAEASRGLLGSTVFLVLIALWVMFYSPVLVLFFSSIVLVERSRAARVSSLLDPLSEEEDDEPDEKKALGLQDYGNIGLQAVIATLLLGLPAASFITPEILADLRSVGFLTAIPEVWLARISVVGTVFLASGIACFVVRTRLVRRGGTRKLPALQAGRPFTSTELMSSILKAALLLFPLVGITLSPWALLPAFLILPALIGAMGADTLDPLTPTSVLEAMWRTPGYLRTCVIGAPLLVCLYLPAWPPWADARVLWTVPIVLAGATLLGVLCGIARHDAEVGVEPRPKRDRVFVPPVSTPPGPDAGQGGPQA